MKHARRLRSAAGNSRSHTSSLIVKAGAGGEPAGLNVEVAETSSPLSPSSDETPSRSGQSLDETDGKEKKKKHQSSWDAKNPDGDDYLYTLGRHSDNTNITVGARQGMVDSLFTGDFLGQDSDIVFKYRQKVTRSFEHLQGDYYIAPAFLDKVATFLAKNFLADQLNCNIPLILGIWGGKGQGKTFQTELIFKALGVEPVIMSAGEMESEWAGEPGKLIRTRYREASQVIKNKGKLSCLMINDLDAGIGHFAHTQVTVNNQMVFGTLMNLADNPRRVSVGQDWREADVVNRVPIIVTGNDFSTMWAPLIRDGRMEKFYWQPTREDIVKIVGQMYINDDMSQEQIEFLVDTFPGQALDFYGALRSRTYDEHVMEWVESVGGAEKMAKHLMSRSRPGEQHPDGPTIVAPQKTMDDLIRAGRSLEEEQRMVMSLRLSDEYMQKQTGPGIGIGFS